MTHIVIWTLSFPNWIFHAVMELRRRFRTTTAPSQTYDFFFEANDFKFGVCSKSWSKTNVVPVSFRARTSFYSDHFALWFDKFSSCGSLTDSNPSNQQELLSAEALFFGGWVSEFWWQLSSSITAKPQPNSIGSFKNPQKVQPKEASFNQKSN